MLVVCSPDLDGSPKWIEPESPGGTVELTTASASAAAARNSFMIEYSPCGGSVIGSQRAPNQGRGSKVSGKQGTPPAGLCQITASSGTMRLPTKSGLEVVCRHAGLGRKRAR